MKNHMIRARLFSLLTGDGKFRITSHGCGSRTSLAYRVTLDSGKYGLFDSRGQALSGGVTDDDLRELVSAVIDELASLRDSL